MFLIATVTMADSGSDKTSNNTRLAPRTTGRRFRRVEVRSHGETSVAAQSDEDAEVEDPSTVRRRPREDIESRISEAIRARKKQVNPSLNEEDLPGETEILGDYEYLDHTADIQLHSWGASFDEALKMQIMAMFGYMTKLSLVHDDEEASDEFAKEVIVRGHDVQSLVFAFLQEWLTLFHETGFIVKEIYDFQFDRQQWSIRSSAKGECFDPSRHTQGTEVKAVTYSNLTVEETEERCDIWVIVDI